MRTTCGISSPFELLFPASGQVTYVLRTHSPLNSRIATRASFDLHVLSTPPAFILSQDQTLRMTSTGREDRSMFGDLLSTAGYTTRRSGRPSRKRDSHPKLLTMVLLPTTLQLLRCRSRLPFGRRQSGADVTTPRCPCQERHKNRCKLFMFASAQLQACSLGCTVWPAHGGLNDLLADYTQAGIPVKGRVEIGAWTSNWGQTRDRFAGRKTKDGGALRGTTDDGDWDRWAAGL